MTFKYEAPKLTKYGKVTEFIQAGSVVIGIGDVTGDGVDDTLFDTDGDGLGDLVVGGANGGQTPVTFTGGFFATQYDADGDGLPGIGSNRFGELRAFRTTRFGTAETGADDGWDDPDRD